MLIVLRVLIRICKMATQWLHWYRFELIHITLSEPRIVHTSLWQHTMFNRFPDKFSTRHLLEFSHNSRPFLQVLGQGRTLLDWVFLLPSAFCVSDGIGVDVGIIFHPSSCAWWTSAWGMDTRFLQYHFPRHRSRGRTRSKTFSVLQWDGFWQSFGCTASTTAWCASDSASGFQTRCALSSRTSGFCIVVVVIDDVVVECFHCDLGDWHVRSRSTVRVDWRLCGSNTTIDLACHGGSYASIHLK